MRLTEELHKKFDKLLYHGSYRGDIDIEFSRFKYFYATLSFKYALNYVIDSQHHLRGAIYKMHLKRDCNLFNANDSDDYKKLGSYLKSHNEDFLLANINALKKQDWTKLDFINNGKDINRTHLYDILEELGYDGFYNFEATDQFNGYRLIKDEPCIGVLDMDSAIEFEDAFVKEEIKDMDEYKILKEQELEDFRDFFYVELRKGRTADEVLDYDVDKFFNEFCIRHKVVMSYMTLTKSDMRKIVANFDKKKFEEQRLKESLSTIGLAIRTNGKVKNGSGWYRLW